MHLEKLKIQLKAMIEDKKQSEATKKAIIEHRNHIASLH